MIFPDNQVIFSPILKWKKKNDKFFICKTNSISIFTQNLTIKIFFLPKSSKDCTAFERFLATWKPFTMNTFFFPKKGTTEKEIEIVFQQTTIMIFSFFVIFPAQNLFFIYLNFYLFFLRRLHGVQNWAFRICPWYLGLNAFTLPAFLHILFFNVKDKVVWKLKWTWRQGYVEVVFRT